MFGSKDQHKLVNKEVLNLYQQLLDFIKTLSLSQMEKVL